MNRLVKIKCAQMKSSCFFIFNDVIVNKIYGSFYGLR